MSSSTSAALPTDIPPESTKSSVLTVVNTEEVLIKLEPLTGTETIDGYDEVGNESSFAKYKGPSIAERLLKDQLDRVHSLADTHIVCGDGHVPFHRIFLMAASEWLSDLLWDEDPSELTVIHLPDVKVVNVVQVLFLLYCGEAAYKKADEPNIFTIFQLLGISTNGFQSRVTKDCDPSSNLKLRFYTNLLQDDEGDFIPRFLRNVDSEILTVNDISNSPSEKNNVCRSDQSDVLPSKIQPDVAETNAVVSNSDVMKCLNCNIIFTTELAFYSHLSTTCGSCLTGKYSYSDKECFGCHEKFPSYNLYRLINHVETCKNLEAAFSCKEAFFVSVNSSKKVMKENVQIEAELSQVGLIDLPVQTNNKIGSNIQEETTGRQKRRGRKRRKGGNQKNAIKIVDHLELADKDTGNEKSATSINEDELLRMEGETHDIEGVDEETLCEEHDLYHPSKKRTRHNSTITMSLRSSQTSCGEIRPQSSNSIVIPDFVEQEEIECIVENDLSARTTRDLRRFLTCSVCKVSYRDIKAASKCQRKHGLKRCWVCVKSLPCNPDSFNYHIVSKHVIPDTDGKVNCSFCPKQFDYTGIAIHMGHYHFPKLFKPKERKSVKGVKSVTQIKTPEKDNCGNVKENVSAENASMHSTPRLDCSREDIGVIIISDYSDASQDDSYISSANSKAITNFVPADNDVEIINIDDDDPHFSGNQPPERRNAVKNPSPTAKTARKAPTLSTPPKLGRVLLQTKEIDGLSYNIYGLPNPTGTDRRNAFSKVIAIRNIDSQSKSNK